MSGNYGQGGRKIWVPDIKTFAGPWKSYQWSAPWIIGCASAECIQYWKWVWPSINSVDPSHCAAKVWCFSHVWFWNYSLSKVKIKHSYVWKMLCAIGCRSLLLLWSSSWWVFSNIGKFQDPAAARPNFAVLAASGIERCTLNVKQLLSSLVGQWISLYF